MRAAKTKAAGAGTHGGRHNKPTRRQSTPHKNHPQDRQRIAATLRFLARLDRQREKAVRS